MCVCVRCLCIATPAIDNLDLPGKTVVSRILFDTVFELRSANEKGDNSKETNGGGEADGNGNGDGDGGASAGDSGAAPATLEEKIAAMQAEMMRAAAAAVDDDVSASSLPSISFDFAWHTFATNTQSAILDCQLLFHIHRCQLFLSFFALTAQMHCLVSCV